MAFVFSNVLSTQAAHAEMNRCEGTFAPKHLAKAARLQNVANDKYDRGDFNGAKAVDVWAAAMREGRPSVDTSLLQKVVLTGIPESAGIHRVAVPLVGDFRPVLKTEGKKGPIFKVSGKIKTYAGREYIEFPNSTLISVPMPNGEVRVWMFTRGVRPYEVGINRSNGEISPKGYVSDVLMFEIIDNKAIFHSVFLESAPEVKFLFEDPRAVDPQMVNGVMNFKLAGTDYSPHKPKVDNPDGNPDVMNRYIDIAVSKDGVPQKPAVDAVTKTPDFKDLSPAPRKKKNGKYIEVDAKNATVTLMPDGTSVVHTRLRPNFNDPDLLALFDGKRYDYALQAFIFKTDAERMAYDWSDALLDLTGKATSANTRGSIRPISAKELVRDNQLPEHLEVPAGRDDLKIKPGVKGIGNGTRPLLTRRVGDLILTQDVSGAGEFITGVLTPSERATYPLKDGESAPIRFDHEIRKVQQTTPGGVFTRRHYSMSFTVFNGRMDKITDYLPDVIQPLQPHELGANSGILDLLHVYPMGIALVPKSGKTLRPVDPKDIEFLRKLAADAAQEAPTSEIAKGIYKHYLEGALAWHGMAVAKVSGGSSDANTDLYDADLKVMLGEAKAFTKKAGGPFKKPASR